MDSSLKFQDPVISFVDQLLSHMREFGFKVEDVCCKASQATSWVDTWGKYPGSSQVSSLSDGLGSSVFGTKGSMTSPPGSLGSGRMVTLKTFLAQVLNASSCPQSSSPSFIFRILSPPSSSRRVSTAWPKAQKCGYALEPRPNTENLARRQEKAHVRLR